MGKKKKKTRRDTAEIARSVVEQAIGESLTPREDEEFQGEQAPTSLGPTEGGKARAMKLSKQRRGEIAKKAAQARWGRRR